MGLTPSRPIALQIKRILGRNIQYCDERRGDLAFQEQFFAFQQERDPLGFHQSR